MQFSIITPSFRSSEWLKLCIPSVADQAVELEHIVQDSVSDDGTLEWLPGDARVKACIEKDQGMYDAVNRGLRKAKGEILAYINCDEQYLPGALSAVWDFFERNPEVDVVFADTIVVNGDGSFNCFRKVHIPERYHAILWDLSTLTSSMFFRRSVIDRHGLFFEPRLKDLGDVDWVLRALEKRIRMKVFRHYTSTFTETGENMNLRPNASRERAEFKRRAPGWARAVAPVFKWKYRVRRLCQGGFWQKPFSYSIFTKASPEARVTFQVDQPKALWHRPPPAALPETAGA